MTARAPVNIEDLQERARRRLPKVVYDYLAGGAEDEVTLANNRSAFRSYQFHPKVLTGVGKPDLSIEILGRRSSAPFLVGPTGLNGLFRTDGDVLLARAAFATGVAFTLSSASTTSIEKLAREAPGGAKWFQLYPWGDFSLSERLLTRAGDAGYEVLVVTVDALTPGKRERDLRNDFAHDVRFSARTILDGLSHPGWLSDVWLAGGMPRLENLVEFLPATAVAHDLADFMRESRNAKFSWPDLRRIRDLWQGPLLVKGIMRSSDAIAAREAGADGIVVSNHGGRQLDGAAPTIDVVADIAAAVKPKLKVLIDGGFRRGTDIVKALALGADAVMLGRATLFGLAAAGMEGVQQALGILSDETSRTMALLGCPSVAALKGGDFVRRALWLEQRMGLHHPTERDV